MTVFDEPVATGTSLTGVMKNEKLVFQTLRTPPTATPAVTESDTADSKSSTSPSCWKRMRPAFRSSCVKVS
ncbi:hypothetical protein D3C87_916580 [compost metagenome]